MTDMSRPTAVGPTLETFFWPQSVAVIGASPKPEKISAKLIGVLRSQGYDGELYAVNSRYDEILGLPTYGSIRAIPRPVDLAMIVVGAAAVPDVLADCVAADVPYAIIISSGFGEGDGQGAQLGEAITSLTADGAIRVSGPNTEGFFNVRGSVAATFSPAVEMLAGDSALRPGAVSVVAQSGGLGFALFNDGVRRGLGFGFVVTTGNESDLECLEYADYLLDDEQTRVVVLFLEGLHDPRRLQAVAAKALRLDKHLIAAKVGVSDAGQRAAVSHTAHLVGNDDAYDAVFRKLAITRAVDQEELIDFAMAFARAPLPAGDRIGVLTTSGGGGTWMADALEHEDLRVPELSDPLQSRIRALIPDYGSAVNPVDATAQVVQSAGGLCPLLEALAASGEVDGIVLVTSLSGPELLGREEAELARALTEIQIPVLIYTYSGVGEASIELLSRLDLAYYTTSRRAARAMQALVQRARHRELDAPGAVGLGAQTVDPIDGGPLMIEHRAKAVLQAAGLRIPEGGLVVDGAQAGELAERLGGRVAVKVQASELPHKTEIGGVRLALQGASEVEDAVQAMTTAIAAGSDVQIEGFLVERMAEAGAEMILGAYRDDTFGPMCLVGFGGIYAEVLQDTVLNVAPVSCGEAHDMIMRMRGVSLLQGARGGEPADVAALADALVRVSELISTHPEISEIDLNPVFVHPVGRGVTVADAVIVTDVGVPSAPAPTAA